MRKFHSADEKRLHSVWSDMKRRCKNPSRKNYPHYDGRGITVCPEWEDFNNFYEWAIANGYSQGLSLDRINNNGNYEPDNCKWSTVKEQNDNRSCTVKFTYNGETRTLTEWSELYGLKYGLLYDRIFREGLSFEEAIHKPYEKRERLIKYNGKTQNLTEWSKELGLSYGLLKNRLNKLHWTVEKAFNTPAESYYWNRKGEKDDQ